MNRTNRKRPEPLSGVQDLSFAILLALASKESSTRAQDSDDDNQDSKGNDIITEKAIETTVAHVHDPLPS